MSDCVQTKEGYKILSTVVLFKTMTLKFSIDNKSRSIINSSL